LNSTPPLPLSINNNDGEGNCNKEEALGSAGKWTV
jgi:hypothetical protein